MRELIQSNTAYLHLYGYADHDVYEIVQAGHQQKPTGTDNRPKADIVKAANVVYLAGAALTAYNEGDMETAFELAIYATDENSASEMLARYPGLSAEFTGYKKHLILGIIARDGLKKWAKKAVSAEKAGQARLQKNKEYQAERDRQLCRRAKEWLKSGEYSPSAIVGALEKQQCQVFSIPNPLSGRQIRRILLAGDVSIPKRSPKKK